MAIGDIVSTLLSSPAAGRQQPLPTLTPDSIKRRRLLAEAMMKDGMDYSPVASPWQGAARLAQGALGGMEAGKADKDEREGVASGNAAMTAALAAALGGGSAPAPAAGTGRPMMAGSQGDSMARYAQAIQKNESGGDYGIVGPTHPKYGRALGAYQVMEANLPQWSQEAVGRTVTPDEFLASKDIQDAVFQKKFGGYVEKYGNPQDAASVWFTGKPQIEGSNRRDVLGTTGKSYVDKFSRALGQGVQVASADPSFVPQAQGLMAYASPQGAPASAVQSPQAPAPQQMAQAPQQAPQAPQDPTADAGNPVPPEAMQQVAQAAASPQVQQAARAAAQTPQGQQLLRQSQSAPLAAIMAAMSNPWVGEGQKAMLMMIAREKMGENDPMRQLQMLKLRQELSGGSPAEQETRRLDIESKRLGIEKTRKDLNMPNGELVKDSEGNPIGFFDKQSLQFKPVDMGGANTGAKAPTVQRVKQPDGSEVAVQWDKDARSWVPLKAPEGGNPVTSPKLTEQQSKDVILFNRGNAVIERMEKQDKALTDPFSAAGGQVSNYLKSDAYRQAEQTGRELLAVILRKDTGAAVTDSEMALYGNTFLPKPADDAATIEQKRQARKVAMESIRMGLGSADVIFRAQEAAKGAQAPAAGSPQPQTAPIRRYNPRTGTFEVVQ